jgi:tetratricopeptide (TPR) repeat protein/transglutaminase-like putative cysteine protease
MPFKAAFAVLFLVGFALSPVLAQVKSGEKPASAAQDFSKEAYVIEKLYTRITAEADGSDTRERTAEIRILADAGVKAFAVLSFTYTSANEVVDVDYVRVRKPDGTEVKTPDYNIQDMPADVTRSAPMYSDIHEKHVAVKGLAVGDVLEYLIRYRVVKPQVPGQFWYEDSFITEGIVKDERLEISLPSDKYVKVVSPDFKPEIKEAGGRRIYLWTHSNLEVKEKDPHEIPRRVPPNPSVQVTTFATWEDIGRWYGSLQKDPLEVTPAIQAKAAELTKGLKTDDEKIHALYNFVALQFHYIGLDFGIGRYQPHAADDVLGNGYGDCKDKHTLLASLLKAAGIDAWPALIHASRKLDPEVPSPAQFNHVITVVPRGDQMIWLDTTPEVAPYQLLMTMLRDKQALVIPSNKPPVLMMTPANPPSPQEQRFTSEGKLDASGTFTGHVEQVYRGDIEVVLRIGFRQLSQSQWKEGVQRWSYGLGFGGDVSNVTVTPPDETDKPFRISYDYVRKNYGGWEDRQITPPIPPNMGIESTKDAKKPQESVLLGAPGEIVYQSKLSLPTGYSVVAPKGVDLVETYAEYHATAKVQDGVLISSRRLVIKKSEVALDNWEGYRDFGKAISDDEWKFIPVNSDHVEAAGTSGHSADLDQKFRDASAAMETGDRSRAQELFEQVIKSDPKYPLAHLNLGSVLMMQNKTTEALAEWHKEQEANPADVRAFQVPATYLTFMNRKDEAILEWRKVLKLDPKNHDAALKLSGLLASEDKHADAAAVLEDALKESPDSASFNMALGEAYVRSGQADKGIPYMEKAMQAQTDPKKIDPGMLNDAAYLLTVNKTHLDVAKEYAVKAVAELDALSVEAASSNDPSLNGLVLCTEFPAAWDTLGWVYFQMGDATRAEDYVHAAWVLGQNGVSGDHLGQIYEKLGKKKQAERAYEQAFAAQGMARTTSWGNATPDQPAEYLARHKDLLSHYEKLTGRNAPPAIEIKRLPNGEWTKTPSEELREALRVKISKTTSVSGKAEFDVVFAPGKVESVRYLKGDEGLRAMAERLEAAQYQMVFPAGSGAKIVRRVQLSCNPTSGCTAELLPPGLMTGISR